METQLKDNALLLFTNGYQTLLTETAQPIIRKFPAMDCDAVFAAQAKEENEDKNIGKRKFEVINTAGKIR